MMYHFCYHSCFCCGLCTAIVCSVCKKLQIHITDDITFHSTDAALIGWDWTNRRQSHVQICVCLHTTAGYSPA